jgi:ABC-type phosphate transport system substrate-binding protein
MSEVQSRNTTKRAGTVVVLMAVVAALGLLSAGTASAASRGFKLHNTSEVALKLQAAKPVPTVICASTAHCATTQYPMDFEGRPDNGSTLAAGGTHTWELKYGFSPFGGVQYAADLWYDIAGTSATVEYKIEVWSTSNESQCTVHGSSKYSCSAAGTKLTFKG